MSSRIRRFGSRCSLVVGAAMLVATAFPAAAGAGPSTTRPPTAYVTNSQLDTVSVYSGSKFAGTIPDVGPGPTGIAVDSLNDTAYVADFGFLDQPAQTVTPVHLATGTAGKPITVGAGPLAVAITPGGRFALVTLQGSAAHPGHQVREINLASRAVSAPVAVGLDPESLAISPDGTMAYVADFGSAEVTPVSLTTWPPTPEAPIPLPGTSPRAIAISPSGDRAYVLDAANATIIPVSLPSGKVGTPVDLVCRMEGDPGCTPSAICISPDGRTAYVAAAGSGDVILLALPSLTMAGVVEAGAYPDALGLTGKWLYVGNGASNTMTVFSGLGAPKTVGGVTYPFGVAVVPGNGEAGPAAAPTRAGRGGGASVEALHQRTAPFYGLAAPSLPRVTSPDVNTPDDPRGLAVLLHPHPDYGGNRFHPFIGGMFRRLPEVGVGALRFDFSSSEPSAARAEVTRTIDSAASGWPGLPVALVGYSFGAGIAAQTGDERVAAWFLLAPPAATLAAAVIGMDTRPKAIVVPEHDQFSPPKVVEEVVAGWITTTTETAPGADHFLGPVDAIVDRALQWIGPVLGSPAT